MGMSGSYRWCARALGVAFAVLLLFPGGSVFAQDADATVDMQVLSYVPAVVHVAPGATVVWTNSSPLQHTVTADDGSFDSGMIDPGDTFSMVFDSPGVYQYFCQPHGSAGLHGMAATIVVGDSSGATVQPAPGPTPRPRTPNDYIPTEGD